MGDQQSAGDDPREPEKRPVRFEATVHPGEMQPALEAVADLDLDRIPDPNGGVRLLITAEDAVELVNRGYEVHLLRAMRVKPLDPSLVVDEDSALSWLEQQVKDVPREKGR